MVVTVIVAIEVVEVFWLLLLSLMDDSCGGCCCGNSGMVVVRGYETVGGLPLIDPRNDDDEWDGGGASGVFCGCTWIPEVLVVFAVVVVVIMILVVVIIGFGEERMKENPTTS
jgi:hypothetical protein